MNDNFYRGVSKFLIKNDEVFRSLYFPSHMPTYITFSWYFLDSHFSNQRKILPEFYGGNYLFFV